MASFKTKQRHVKERASEKKDSNWITALLLKRYGLTLTKSKFRDGLDFRYNIKAKHTLINCQCAEKFTLLHVFHYLKGGYTHMRHNEIQDAFAKIMHGVCYDIEFEPLLKLLQRESFIHKTTRTD